MRIVIGVMGGAGAKASTVEGLGVEELAKRTGRAIAQAGCVLLTGATTGLPHLAAVAAREVGGLSIGVSPGSNAREHSERFRLPLEGSDVLIYTGFGLKGRNVINIRSSDVVIFIGGGIGTLNEFTIAHDEGKIIGVLEGSGGVTDRIREIAGMDRRHRDSRLHFNPIPEALVEECLCNVC